MQWDSFRKKTELLVSIQLETSKLKKLSAKQNVFYDPLMYKYPEQANPQIAAKYQSLPVLVGGASEAEVENERVF